MDTLDFSKPRLALGVIAALLLWPSVNFAQVAISYSGDAVAGKGLVGGTAFEVDHLNLPITGGTYDSTATGSKSLLSGAVCLNCQETEKTFLSVQGSGLSSMTEADVDEVVLMIGGHTIRVSTLSINTSAICPTVLGDPAGVVWNGYVGYIAIDDTYTSTADFPGGIMDARTFPIGTDGTVSVNRVASFSSIAAGGDIVVNGLQVDMAAGDQVVVASSHAGVMCPTAPDGGGVSGGCPGKVTGGGVFMLGGKRQTFGFVAGTKKDGTAFGNFNYVNHGTGAHLQGSVQR